MAKVPLLIIASAETWFDKSLQGLQARLNDKVYKKQGNGGHWRTAVFTVLHYIFCWLSLVAAALLVSHMYNMYCIYVVNR